VSPLFRSRRASAENTAQAVAPPAEVPQQASPVLTEVAPEDELGPIVEPPSVPVLDQPSAEARQPSRRTPAPTPDRSASSAPAAPAMSAGGAVGARLGDLLLRNQIISPEALAQALAEQPSSGLRLGALLVQLGLLGEQELAQALSEQMSIPTANLHSETPDAAALALLPESVAREKLALPLRLTENTLEVVAADPDLELAADLSRRTGKTVSLLVAPRSDVTQGLNRAYRVLLDVAQHVQALGTLPSPRTGGVQVDEAPADAAPVVQIVNLVLTQALRDRASDIHLEPQEHQMRVRYRIDGALHDALTLPIQVAPAVVSRIKILAGMNIVERRRPQDGQITMTLDDREIDLRVATTATIWGEKCVLRLLDKNRSLLRLHELGMPDNSHTDYSKLIRAPFGMVLCAGPTGSGKTTTLYATLAELNEPHRNIMTIEDPVEYVVSSINQIQINEQAGVTFATGLKSILRQDPDIILVGEIRDVDTARIAVQSALTGHLVLSSLHATDSAAALHRFLDMGIESFLIASSVVAVVGQRLVRRICSYCKQPFQPTDEELAFYRESGGESKTTFYAGTGCNFCSGTGYRDRIGVYELMNMTPELRRLIVGWATQEELRRMAVSQGMQTLQEEALALIDQDVTTISEVVRAIYTS
jgi:type IV pilus assembly protein PilB